MKAKPGRDGAVTLGLEPAEADLLRAVREQLLVLYETAPGDGARDRLFPRAYLDPTEEDAETHWEAVVHPELLRERLERLDGLVAALDAASLRRRRLDVELSAADVEAWLAVLNDARLAFGSRLEITDDTDVYHFTADDPLAPEKAAYAWLTTLQGVLVEGLLGTLPG